MQGAGRKKLVELNPHLTCVLCSGYFIDATTIIECLHSFCRTCIVRYLAVHKICPVCDVQVHKTRPLLNIRSDRTLQDIVYKLVPGLFKSEMRKRREFYSRLPPSARTALPASSEERGDVKGVERLIFTPEDLISVSLEYSARDVLPIRPLLGGPPEETQSPSSSRRYLCCPGGFTVGHLKKFLRAKFGLAKNQEVDVMYMHDYLLDDYSLMDLAYIYSWRRNAPMRLLYRFPGLLSSMTSSESKDEEVPVPPNDGKSIVITSSSPASADVPTSQPPVTAATTTAVPAGDPAEATTIERPRVPPPPPVLPNQLVNASKVPHQATGHRKNGVVPPNGVHSNLRLILPAPAKANGVDTSSFSPHKAADGSPVLAKGALKEASRGNQVQSSNTPTKRPCLDSSRQQRKEAAVS